ncbi:hypothetical protein GF373_06320 [bacterium]|nr:hypothetical protein [bacterium]
MKTLYICFILFFMALSNLPARGEMSNYCRHEIQGWAVFIEKPVLKDKTTSQHVMDLLTAQLVGINRMVPRAAAAKLHSVTIWVDLNHREFKCAVYHPSQTWLKNHGFDPNKAKSVHLANVKNFLKWTKEQPWMVMHEMAHAYHHQCLGHDHLGIKQAFNQANETKIYDQVLHINGKTVKAYAMNNAKEYFAELTEAYFGTNDMFPFVRAEIQQHDPDMFKILQKAWGKRE